MSRLLNQYLTHLAAHGQEIRRVGALVEESAHGTAGAPRRARLHTAAKVARDSAATLTVHSAGLYAIAERLDEFADEQGQCEPSGNEERLETASVFREAAANVLAAAFVKASGGDIARSTDWAPACRAAEAAVDALVDYALACLHVEMRDQRAHSGRFAVASTGAEPNNRETIVSRNGESV